MKTSEAIKLNLDTANMVTMAYLGDMSSDDLLKRPHPQCNHINWQVGHLIDSEHQMAKAVNPNQPALPAGFTEKYSRENAMHDDPTKFCTKDELMAVYQTQRDAVLATLAQTADSDWQKETGISYAPTVASMYTMMGGHWLMHCGQWVVVRRQLNKPVVI